MSGLFKYNSVSPVYFYSVKVIELPPVNPAFSSVILWFVKICLSIFPFNVLDKLSVQIRLIPEVSLLI